MHDTKRTTQRLANVSCVSMALLVLATSCSSPSPTVAPQSESITVSLAPTDQARDWTAEHARTREQNRTLPAFTAGDLEALMAEPANIAALKSWRETRSYYALLEIVEGIIEPRIGSLRRADIEQLLGKGDPDYPNSHGRVLHYAGDRRIPEGSHVLIEFDEKGIVKDIGWVSE